MSEMPTPAPTPAPATPPAPEPAPAPPTPSAPDPVDAAGWEAKYRGEVADRIKERNLYKPAQRLLSDLDEDSRAELIRLADMARTNDAEGIAQWSLDTIRAVSGKDAAAYIAERQAREQGTPAPGLTAEAPKPVPGMTPEEVRQMVREEQAEQARLEQGRQHVTNTLKEMGYDVNSAAGKTIVGYAVDNKADLDTARKWFENDIVASVSARQRAASAAAATVPGTAPAGAPAGSIPDGATSREKALARLAAEKSPTS